jgi:hypothetical protein
MQIGIFMNANPVGDLSFARAAVGAWSGRKERRQKGQLERNFGRNMTKL